MSTTPDPWFSAHAAIAAHIADPRCALAREVIRVMGYMEPTNLNSGALRRAVLRDLSSAADHCGDGPYRAGLQRARAALEVIDLKVLTIPLAEFPGLVAEQLGVAA